MSSNNTKINVHEAHELANAFKNIDVDNKKSSSKIINLTKLNGVNEIEEMSNEIPNTISEITHSTIVLANDLPSIAAKHENFDKQNAKKIKNSNNERRWTTYDRKH